MHCSLTGGSSIFKIHVAKSNPANLTIIGNNADDVTGWCAALTLFVRLSAYISILAIITIVIFLVLKYITDVNDYESATLEEVIESNPLRPGKATEVSYGTCHADLESGQCSIGDSSSNCSGNSSMELYDGKLCVICYDEERNCFFVPCGHCATCYVCARRIFYEENRFCPVCRRYIGKIRKLFAS